MKHAGYAETRTQMLGIGGDFDHRVTARPHQQIVDLAFVLVRDIGDGLGQREDEMEIPHGQQFGLACGQPCLCRTCLTFWAVTIATGIIGNVFMRAVSATRNMTAECGGAAALDCRHHHQLGQADVPLVGSTPVSTMGAEDIRNLQ
jgi:hypothetical protein